MKAAFRLSIVLVLAVASQVCAQPENRQRQRERRGRFPQVFSLPGVEWSEDQLAQVEELRTAYEPKLRDVQRRRAEIDTPEQRRARREALEAAREAGKQGRELREAVERAVQQTDEQKQQLAEVQQEQQKLVAGIQQKLRALLTAEQRRALERNNQRRRAGAAPTHRDVQYGPYERNVLDVWLAESDKPTPVLVSIHGGGFRGGNKSVDGGLLRACLDSGISVVAITYRLSDEAIAPAQFLDSARAIQFVRSKSGEWNLDPRRMAATGGSAGAGLSLWLGFHDDLADPDNSDPVLRQSTRLSCMAVYNGQTSYDPRFIRELFPDTNTYQHSALAQLYDVDLNRLDDLPAEKYRLFEETSPIAHLTKDDAPAMLSYASEMDTPIRNQGVGIHHPKFGKVLQEKMEALGIECEVYTGVQRGGDDVTQRTMKFLQKHLGVEGE